MDAAAATGFAGLSLAMAVGRFSGDWRAGRKPGHFARNPEIHC
jgi:hypothetical protein